MQSLIENEGPKFASEIANKSRKGVIVLLLYLLFDFDQTKNCNNYNTAFSISL